MLVSLKYGVISVNQLVRREVNQSTRSLIFGREISTGRHARDN
jgi:hypothetical protein